MMKIYLSLVPELIFVRFSQTFQLLIQCEFFSIQTTDPETNTKLTGYKLKLGHKLALSNLYVSWMRIFDYGMKCLPSNPEQILNEDLGVAIITTYDKPKMY